MCWNENKDVALKRTEAQWKNESRNKKKEKIESKRESASQIELMCIFMDNESSEC